MVPSAVRSASAVLVSTLVACAAACTTGDVAAPADEVARLGGEPSLPPVVPTWFHDVEPIVQRACIGCHVDKGTGSFPLDKLTTTALATLVAEQVSSRNMPPWPPARGGAEL